MSREYGSDDHEREFMDRHRQQVDQMRADESRHRDSERREELARVGIHYRPSTHKERRRDGQAL